MYHNNLFQMLQTINELNISGRVMLRQLRAYSKPREGLRLPRIYRNIDEDPHTNRPLVPLWYNATTSRTAYEEKNPSKRRNNEIVSSSSTTKLLPARAQSLPAKMMTRELNVYSNYSSFRQIRIRGNITRYVVTTAPIKR